MKGIKTVLSDNNDIARKISNVIFFFYEVKRAQNLIKIKIIIEITKNT